MLNKKKQIILLDKIKKTKDITLFNLPGGYSHKSYFQTINAENRQIENVRFLFKKTKKIVYKKLTELE